MSDKKDTRQIDKEQESEVVVDQELLAQLVELFQQPVKLIYQDGPTTVIEFNDGQKLPLHGGGAKVTDYVEPSCSFCRRSQSELPALAAPPNTNSPAICPDCAIGYVELFAQSGIEIKLNVSIAPKLAEALAGLRSQNSPECDK